MKKNKFKNNKVHKLKMFRMLNKTSKRKKTLDLNKIENKEIILMDSQIGDLKIIRKIGLKMRMKMEKKRKKIIYPNKHAKIKQHKLGTIKNKTIFILQNLKNIEEKMVNKNLNKIKLNLLNNKNLRKINSNLLISRKIQKTHPNILNMLKI